MSNEKPAFRWFILVALIFATATNAVTLISPAPLIGEFIPTLHSQGPGPVVFATMGTFNLFGALAAIAGGWLLDRLGFTKVWLGGLVLMVLGAALTPAFGKSIVGLGVLRSIAAIGGGPIMASAGKVAAEWFVPEERGIVTGAQGLSMGVGIMVGFILAPMFNGMFHSPFMALAGVSIVGIIAFILALVVAFGPKAPVMEQPAIAGANTDSLFSWSMSQKSTWFAMIAVVALGWFFQEFNDIVPSYIAIPGIGLGRGPAVAGKYMGMVSIALMVGAAISPFVTEKIFRGSARPTIFVTCILFAIFSFAIKLPGVTGGSALLPCLVLAGLFMAMINPVLMAFFAKNYPEQVVGRLCGTAQGISMFAGTAGVTVGAWALHHFNGYQVPITIMVVLGILGAIGGLGMHKPGEVKSATRVEA